MAEYIEREKFIEAVRGRVSWPVDNLIVELTNAIPAADVVSRDCYDRLLAENDDLRKARPVVRGKWIEHYEPYSTGEEMIEAQYGYECSICGRWEYEKEPFCNCGAKMEES